MKEERFYRLLKEKKYVDIKKELSEMNSVDVAERLGELDPETRLLIFRTLPKDLAVEVFASFSREDQEEILNIITEQELNHILDEIFFDDMIDMIEEMPANIVNKILENSSVEERRLINQFLKYPVDSAGTIMTIEYVELRQEMTVAEALDHIKEIGLTKETIYTCYVTNNNRILEGIISLRTLVIENEDMKISELMEKDVIYVNTHDDQEKVANVFNRYRFLALPVVDNEHRLTGIITVDDVMDVMEQEATEDFQRMAAIEPVEDAYLDTGVFHLARKRFVWLLILMISAILTEGIINRFEETISKVVALIAFMPMLMDTGGNGGSQSSTLIIRGLALGEITLKDTWKVLWKEFRVSIVVGVSLAALNFLKNMYFDKVGFAVSITVSVTLIFTIMISKVVGGMLPLVAERLNMDPAMMAGPLITTIVDALALIVYFSMATVMLGI
ncbi:MAG TPA: magnesium transporter [Tissierellaceae bacterium]|nr:magnesium transporter [Tissierellaceae bacterium]